MKLQRYKPVPLIPRPQKPVQREHLPQSGRRAGGRQSCQLAAPTRWTSIRGKTNHSCTSHHPKQFQIYCHSKSEGEMAKTVGCDIGDIWLWYQTWRDQGKSVRKTTCSVSACDEQYISCRSEQGMCTGNVQRALTNRENKVHNPMDAWSWLNTPASQWRASWKHMEQYSASSTIREMQTKPWDNRVAKGKRLTTPSVIKDAAVVDRHWRGPGTFSLYWSSSFSHPVAQNICFHFYK